MRIKMAKNEDQLHEQQFKQFEHLRDLVEHMMEQFGRPDFVSGPGDFCVLGDYWGHPQVKVDIHDLSLLHPHIVTRLQNVVADFPGWEIVYTVTLRDHLYDWPNMGLYIRPHEIFDTLQRQYFPKEFQDYHYEGSRRGTEAQATNP